MTNKTFWRFGKKKLIFQDLRPLYWSCTHQTVLAESEVEYFEKETTSIIFRLVLGCECSLNDKWDNVGLLVWTTQPWTISENKLVVLNSKSSLFLVSLEENKELFLVSEKAFPFLQAALIKKKGFRMNIIESISSEMIEGLHYKKLYGKGCGRVFLTESNCVKSEEGTGAVHLAPVFGPEDYKLFKELIQEREERDSLICPLNPDGIFNEFSSFKEFIGKNYKEVNSYIIEDLEKRGFLLLKEKYKHSYPHDWRDKQPLVFRLTKQLFIDVDKLKPQILENIKKVKWFPFWTEKKMIAAIEERDNWCFSRQRSWGVPIPVLYDKNENLVMNEKVIGFIAELVKEEGFDGWYNGKFLGLVKQSFPELGENVKLGTDTMDVWFDSGSAFFSQFNIVNVEKDHFIPYSLFLEGDDQFRGWFGSSLILSVALFDCAPYKEVLSHGFVVDNKGKKMSKSLGNVIDPKEVLAKFGPDVIRLWIAEADFTKEIKVGEEKLRNVQSNYQKIRNTLRFLLKGHKKMKEKLTETVEGLGKDSNLPNFVIENERQVIALNRYVLVELSILVHRCRDDYEKYKFSEVCSAILFFCTNILSSFYFEVTKKFLYFLTSSNIYSKMVFVWEEILRILISLIYPIAPFLAEEAYQCLLSFSAFPFKKSLVLEQKEVLNVYSLLNKYSYSNVNKNIVEIRTVLGFYNEMEFDVWIKSFFDELFFPVLRKEIFLVIEKAKESKVIICHKQAIVSLFTTSSTFFLFEQKRLFDKVVFSWVRDWLMIADFGVNKMKRDFSCEELTTHILNENKKLVDRERVSFV